MTVFGRPFLRLFVPLAALLLGSAWLLVRTEYAAEIDHVKTGEQLYVSRGATILERNILSSRRDLKLLAGDPHLAAFVDRPGEKGRREVESHFANLVVAKPVYDQVRVLDRDGMEMVRVDLVNGKAVAVPTDKLQNEGGRHYFTDAMRMAVGDIYISPLDLNIEHGEIERPFKPVLRFAMPLANRQGEKVGIVILNYLAGDLLWQFKHGLGGAIDHAMLVDGEGYWVSAPDPQDEWGSILGHPERTLASRHGAAWNRIVGRPGGQFRDASGLWTFAAIDPLPAAAPLENTGIDTRTFTAGEGAYRWYVVSRVSPDMLAAAHDLQPAALAAIVALVLAVVGYGIFRLQQITAREAELNSRFRAFFQHGMVGMATSSLDHRWLAVNPALCRMLGYSEAELLQKTWSELTFPDDLTRNEEEFDQVLRGEADGYLLEKRFVRKDGQVIDTNIAARCIRKPDHSVDYFVSMIEDITERKRAMRRLEESQSSLRAVSDNLPQSYLYQYGMSADGRPRFLYVSSGVERIHGVEPQAVIASPEALFQGADPASLAQLQCAIDASASHMSSLLEVIRIRRGDGSPGWLQLRSSPHRTDSGEIVWDGVATDVTEQHENELLLQHTARRAQVLLELPQKAEGLDEQTFMQYGMDQAEALTGSRIAFIHLVNNDGEAIEPVTWSSATLEKYGTAMHDRHYPLSKAGIWADAARQKRALIVNDYTAAENRCGPPDGSTALTRLVCVPVVENGDVRMVAGVANKASDYGAIDVESLQLVADLIWRLVSKRKADLALRAASKVVNASSVVCFRWQAVAGWPIDYVSENVRQWGYEADALLDGKPVLSEIVHPDDLARVTGEVVDNTLAGRSNFSQEYRVVTSSGQIRWVVNETNVVRGSDGAVMYYEGVLSDITERKRTEHEVGQALAEQRALNARLAEAHNQLLQSEKMASIGQLAAGVAHELNNPIGFVHSNLGTLEGYLRDLMYLIETYETALAEGGESAAKRRIDQVRVERDFEFVSRDIFQLVSESRDGLDRLRRIVQDLKTFSRVGSQDWEFADLNQGIESTLNIVWNELKYKCKVTKTLAAIPPVFCQVSQLNQVFMNLLVNAGQAIEAKGEIDIRTCLDEEGMVVVEVADTGKGIPPENLSRIFDPFFTTKPVGKGTGLGLSLSYSIVQAHQGRIEVESRPGQGTTFRVILPVNHAGSLPTETSGPAA